MPKGTADQPRGGLVSGQDIIEVLLHYVSHCALAQVHQVFYYVLNEVTGTSIFVTQRMRVNPPSLFFTFYLIFPYLSISYF